MLKKYLKIMIAVIELCITATQHPCVPPVSAIIGMNVGAVISLTL